MYNFDEYDQIDRDQAVGELEEIKKDLKEVRKEVRAEAKERKADYKFKLSI